MNASFIKYFIVIFLCLSLAAASLLDAQNGRGDKMNRARNIHSGNLIRVTYWNHGMLGSIRNDNSIIYGGEWPINSKMVQMGNASSYVMSELNLTNTSDNDEGWRVVAVTDTGITAATVPLYHGSGGNPLGYISSNNVRSGQIGIWYWSAPQRYLGKMDLAYNETLNFDLLIKGAATITGEPDLILENGDKRLVYDLPTSPTSTWKSFSVVLNENGWKKDNLNGAAVSDTLFKVVLANLTKLLIRGEWEQQDGLSGIDNIILNQDPLLGLPVISTFESFKVTPVVFCQGWDPNMFSHDDFGNFLGFEPLPGYFNANNTIIDQRSAISHQPVTWPTHWPDKVDDMTDPGWRGKWNGYFGKHVFNADQESYHVLDDYQFKKKFAGIALPPPVVTDLNRGGLGFRKALRGFQWANPSAEDCIFWIYDIKNIGQTDYTKTLFGLNVGASMGAYFGMATTDYDDDCAQFYREIGLTVNYDWGGDNSIGTGGYSPVPWVGFAFLESPGNPYDGIDNDGDAIDASGGGRIITQSDFRTMYAPGDFVILIDYESPDYQRRVVAMPDSFISFVYDSKEYRKYPNALLFEIPRNGMDDNLNGVIDENDGVKLKVSATEYEEFYLYIRSQYNARDYMIKDYITGDGLTNLMIDERRDDGIDNDGDWDLRADDVGLDGAEGSGDIGEGDGLPTPGAGELPGEPNIDRVDVSESDQIGLTSFVFYEYGQITYSNDEQMWERSQPGYFDDRIENVDADYIFSTGFFPLLPGIREAFSVAMIYGWNETDIINNKNIVQEIYDANYNFAMVPKTPNVYAVPGDGKVTLYWDETSESSYDRYLKDYDFEGFKIYRATDPGFADATEEITSGDIGSLRITKPLATYDKVDGVHGYYPKAQSGGLQFFLGNETGLVHTFVDSNLINGRRYYYAVTAFDKGSLDDDILPSETTKYIAINAAGRVQEKGANVVIVTPNAPAAGYEPPEFNIQPQAIGDEIIGKNILRARYIEPDSLKSDQQFEIAFIDITNDSLDNDGDGLIDSLDTDEMIPLETTGFMLRNITNPALPETLSTVIFKEYRWIDSSWTAIRNLYLDDDKDESTLRALSQGFEFFIYNPSPGILDDTSRGISNGVKWSQNINPEFAYPINFGVWDETGFVEGNFYPRQYKIVFNDELAGMSSNLDLLRDNGTKLNIKATATNFGVYDLNTGQEMPYAFKDASASKTQAPPGHFGANDRLWLYETLPDNSKMVTFYLDVNMAGDDKLFMSSFGRTLSSGDTLYLFASTQFTAQHRYQFSVKEQRINPDKAKTDLKRIRVVPNPYNVTTRFEPETAYSSGRGPRQVRFIHLPRECTIRIFAVDGTLVRRIEHNSAMTDGSEPWDLLTKDNMEVAYGMYIYHVDAPGLGEQVGRMIIIK